MTGVQTCALPILFVQVFIVDVPLTVYVVFTDGLLVILALTDEVFQVYVPAPLAVKVTVLPEQITVLLGLIVIVGVAFTLKF